MNGPPPALLLSQVGALVSDRWARRLRDLGITPSEGVVLRMLAQHHGISQRDLADRMGIVTSRVVALVDALESKGLVTRTRSTTDRRRQHLDLTSDARQVLVRLRGVAAEHEADVLAPLDASQRAALVPLLERLAEGHGLVDGVHPRTGPGPC